MARALVARVPGAVARISLAQAREWLAQRRAAGSGGVERIGLGDLQEWHFAGRPLRLEHRSGRFFAIEGHSVRLERADGATVLHRPLIDQPEVGVLGFLARRFDGVVHLLVQAKMEPGNVGSVQLAPTVQATHSNYTRVHGGRAQPLLDHFLGGGRGRVVVDELQPEQAAYFVRKHNRNIVVEASEEVAAGEDFRWLALEDLRALLRWDFAVNMDARSVLSCIPPEGWPPHPAPVRDPDRPRDGFARGVLESARPGAPAEHGPDEIHAWLRGLRARSRIRLVRRPLTTLPGWDFDGRRLSSAADGGLAVGAVAVSAPSREVDSWTQPLLERPGAGCLGLLCQRRSGSVHMLVQATVEPGCPRVVQLSPTVALHDDRDAAAARGTLPPLADWFEDPRASHVRFSALHSEEGGRFAAFVYRYTIAEAPADAAIDVPPGYRWMTLDQLAALRRLGFASIELRSVTACLAAAGTGDPAHLPSGSARTSGT